MGLFDFNKERFFNDHEKLILDKICLNLHDHLNNPDIKNFEQWSQEGKYTKAGTPFYWYSEFYDFTYKYKTYQRGINFYKYFYKNKKDYENIKGLELSFSDEYSSGYWDENENNFPATYIAIHCPSTFYQNLNIEGTLVKMEYDGHMVAERCETKLKEETLKTVNKMFQL